MPVTATATALRLRLHSVAARAGGVAPVEKRKFYVKFITHRTNKGGSVFFFFWSQKSKKRPY